MIKRAPLIIVIVMAASVPETALAETACYDVKIHARPVDQIPSATDDCGEDCILISWPWFVDLQINRISYGSLPDKVVRVLSVQHTYRTSREGTWLLRKNTADGYNVVTSESGAALARCSAGAAPVEPYIQAGGGQSLDDLRDAGIRRYGHHR